MHASSKTMAFCNREEPIFGQEHKSRYILLLKPPNILNVWFSLKENEFIPQVYLFCISFTCFDFFVVVVLSRNEVGFLGGYSTKMGLVMLKRWDKYAM